MPNRHTHIIRTDRSVNIMAGRRHPSNQLDYRAMEMAAQAFHSELPECSCGECDALTNEDWLQLQFLVVGTSN